MDYLVELYDAKGKCVASAVFPTPMEALRSVGQRTINEKGFVSFVTATCYYKQVPQWELEIK